MRTNFRGSQFSRNGDETANHIIELINRIPIKSSSPRWLFTLDVRPECVPFPTLSPVKFLMRLKVRNGRSGSPIVLSSVLTMSSRFCPIFKARSSRSGSFKSNSREFAMSEPSAWGFSPGSVWPLLAQLSSRRR